MNAVPDGLQGGPPVGGLVLLLAPEHGGQDQEEESERRPREQGHQRGARTDPAPRIPEPRDGRAPTEPPGRLSSSTGSELHGFGQVHAHASFPAGRRALAAVTALPREVAPLGACARGAAGAGQARAGAGVAAVPTPTRWRSVSWSLCALVLVNAT